ncbi:hypothetical protein BpHYR1_024679 [Brachionus plicatilis]|uniref:Uncharacterized protein n=1 Tax=Brachionus plicatilis TaxID=10195 RepID=A0A3M7SDA6_BRAPC|nr:hypothetical protein BpHYR1_024679 [Brachionus plicatilis]
MLNKKLSDPDLSEMTYRKLFYRLFLLSLNSVGNRTNGHFGGQAGGQKFGPLSWPAKLKTDDEICDRTISAKKISLRIRV